MGTYRVLLFTVVLTSVLATPVQETNKPKETDPGYRLPGDVIPSEYTIVLKPYLEHDDPEKAFSFEGNVQIKAKTIKEGIRKVVLHAKGLIIDDKPTITPNNPIIEMDYDEKYEFLFLNLDRALNNDTEYTISFKYKAKLQDDMTGFYKSYYKEGNVTKWLATTQFEQLHARKAIPCFDEPGYKAVFKMSFDCPEGLKCVTNMKEKSKNGNVITYYETPPMAPYLMAFLVSEFESAVSTEKSEFAIWYRKESTGQAEYPLEKGVKVVKELEDYTKVPYYDIHPDSQNVKMKMDQVAVPDFSAGAMENWGLITYKESALLIDPIQSSTSSKQRTASILAHEIAHMWFGDLVTCKWWSETWLNEGFATFFANYITNKVVPGMHHDKQFTTSELHTGMSADSSLDSTPLTNKEVNTPSEVSGSFGTISYQKGGSIIRMMEQWIGPETFRKGINYYLTNMTFKAAEPDDLFKYLQSAADEDESIKDYGFDVKQVYDSWTLYAGYPVVMVELDKKEKKMTLKQKRYLSIPNDDNKQLYMIPITYVTAKDGSFDNTKPLFIMNEQTKTVDMADVNDWIILNIQQTGFYRVHYSDEMYDAIIKAFKNEDNRKAVHPNNRAQLIEDAFTFARDGVLKYSKMFEIIQFLENELDYTPWTAAYNGIGTLRNRFNSFESLSADFDMHISKLMEKLIGDLKLDIDAGDDELRRIFRTRTMNLACNMGHETCVNQSVTWFKNWVDDKNFVIPPDHREFVYCNGIRHGELSYFDELWSKYLQEKVVNEQMVILGALGCARNETQISQYLTYTLNRELIRDQDRMSAFNSIISGNKENPEHVLDFFVHHVNLFRQVYKSNFGSVLSGMADRMSEDQLKDYKAFLGDGKNNLTETDIKRAENSIESRTKVLKWVKTNEEEISVWIKAKYNSAGALGASLSLLVAMVIAVFATQ